MFQNIQRIQDPDEERPFSFSQSEYTINKSEGGGYDLK